MAKQTFTTGQVLTAAQMTSLQQTAMLGGDANARTASYTLVAGDAGNAVSMSSTSATTITVNTGIFAAGDIVTIVNINSGVCTVTAGTATVTSSASLALAQNEGGILRFTSASAAVFLKFAGAGGSSGKLLQVVNGTFSTSTTVASTTFTDTTVSLSITPSATDSKVLVLCEMSTYNESSAAATNNLEIRLVRGSTTILDLKQVNYVNIGSTGGANILQRSPLSYLDSPATTSATTYKIQGRVASTANNGQAIFQVGGSVSTITLLEIGA